MAWALRVRAGVACVVSASLAAAVWSAGGVAGSNPVAAIGSVASSPPVGLHFLTAGVTVWTTAPPAAHPGLAADARQALGSGPRPLVRRGAIGPVRYREASAGRRWSLVQLTPAARAVGQPAALVVMSGVVGLAPGGLASAAERLAATVRRFGPPQVAACVTLVGSVRARPLRVARGVAGRLGAVVVEAVGGPGGADLFARLPGAPTVAVAGRPMNLEVRALRTRTDLVVDVASPFLTPGGCNAPGDGAEAA